MTFKKKSGQVMGLVTATINDEVMRYVFNEKGYKSLQDHLKLQNSMFELSGQRTYF